MEPSYSEGEITDELALKELTGERIVYNKKTGEAATEDPFDHGSKGKKDEMFFEEELVTGGDNFGAVLPFLGALVEPAHHPPVNLTVPKEDYNLEYVYGYRMYDCRQNLYFTSTGKVAYHVAALGIVLDPKTNTQRFFGGGSVGGGKTGMTDQHDDDIICLAISPDRKYVATGQVGPKPALYIWDTETCKLKAPKSKYRVTAKNSRAISGCSWSSDGKYVALIDRSDKRNVYVVDSTTGALAYTESSGAQQVFDIAWSKKPGDYTFATCGARHIAFWNLTSKSHKTGTGHGAQTFSCLTYDDQGTCYAGGIDGNVYIFKGNSLAAKKPAHKGLIHTINWVDGKLMTGGSDRILCIFDSKLTLESKIPLQSTPRALDKQGDQILVGLRNGTIAVVRAGKVVAELMKSHHDGEVWGLEILENGDILTTCDDNKLMMWNAKERRCKGTFTVNEKAGAKKKYGASSMTSYPDNQCSRAVCYNPKTKDVAVATNSGEVQIRNITSLGSVKMVLPAADRWIEFMAYSPNGAYLAVGTHSNTIVVYETASYTSRGALRAHKSSITSLDWSKDSRYIRSNCEAYELLFFNVESMKQDPSGATNTKDVEWASQNTKIGWNVTGVFPKGTDGTHVNGVSLSSDGKLIATGDDWGLVNIYHNPCREGSQPKSFRGHSEHVVRVRFGLGDQYLFSVGGQDKTLMQWKKA